MLSYLCSARFARISMLYALLSMLCPTMAWALSAQAIVGHIIDGDTFSARVNLESGIEISVRVRFLGIDAPELNGECDKEVLAAQASRDRLAQLIPVGGTVKLTNIKDDKYLGRINANIIKDGQDIGKIMIREGHAVQYSGKKRISWCD